ncbi:hypothetical protein LIER_06167 [Lithospermum erythrorhizon]|uniref:DUF4283 domain-containing protein n=1 Tax=Lithospermum erythrorhizon TaxID=34254 RepID=A0AAV3P4I5_LITER
MVEGPLNLHGALLVLDYWRPNTYFQSFQINFANLWVQLHLIPGDYLDYDNLHAIIQALGDVQNVEWHAQNIIEKDFIRVQETSSSTLVRIQITHNLQDLQQMVEANKSLELICLQEPKLANFMLLSMEESSIHKLQLESKRASSIQSAASDSLIGNKRKNQEATPSLRCTSLEPAPKRVKFRKFQRTLLTRVHNVSHLINACTTSGNTYKLNSINLPSCIHNASLFCNHKLNSLYAYNFNIILFEDRVLVIVSQQPKYRSQYL